MKAIWNDTVLADSDFTVVVEGNHYFPPKSVKKEFFKNSDKTTSCPWKGKANYYDVEVEGQTNSAAAWYFPEPRPAAENIRNHVAFWKGIEVKK